jgi:hypothetical protein
MVIPGPNEDAELSFLTKTNILFLISPAMVGTGHSNLGANDALILTGVKVFRNQKNVSLIEAMIGPESILQAYQRLR